MALRLFAVLAALAAPPGLASAAPVTYERDVMPVLSRAGCNMGACHGNLNGKGGLKLSLKGEDPAADLAVLTRDMLGRRTDPHSPDESLILRKATGQAPHEGGVRFPRDSHEYTVLRTWIAAGCVADPPGGPKLAMLTVTPANRILIEPEDRFTITATARFTDGSTRDVTTLANFEQTSIGIAKVLPGGDVLREQNGETVILVRYLDQVVPVRAVFLPNRPLPEMGDLTAETPIDRLVIAQLKELRLTPAGLAPDHVFLRRAHLDALGVLPSAAETREFLSDSRPDRRARLIDSLLARPEFAEYWAQKWADLLRNEVKSLDRKGVAVFYRWITANLADDRPLNDFARDILTARGSTYANPPANFYRAVRDPTTRAESVAQVFLGIRIGCARCHNHPFDRWTIDDYYSFSALFARIDYRLHGNSREDLLDRHEFIGEQVVFTTPDGDMNHPRTKLPAAPKLLGAALVPPGGGRDRLQPLADWVAAKDNPFFARAQVNRIWLHLMGRGLVDPNDDFRATNPASNPALLEWLAKDFADHGFRLKHAVRTIMNSRTYQLAAEAREMSTMGDDSHHAHAAVLPLEAEQLYDAMAKVTCSTIKFDGYPKGLRANQLPAPMQIPRRGGSMGMGERFLKVFGKPDRLLTCECERNDDPGLLQAFQMITGEVVNKVLADPANRIGKSLAAGKSDAEMLDEFYLAALCRFPTDAEKSQLTAYVSTAKDRRAAWEDLVWGLLNAKEFLLRR